MATSPIYNWPEPDNTDLVKNGALAIRTLGDAIDTTMGTMVAKTIVDAKGDLIAGTAADTASRLAVGANGETLVADSSTSTGLRYQGNYAAGKQMLLNANFDIWQRGTSFTGSGYMCDRWQDGNSTSGITASRQTAGAPVGSTYYLRYTSTAAGSYRNLMQLLETAQSTWAWGQTVTFSIKLRRNATLSSGTMFLLIDKSVTTDASSAATWVNISTTGVAVSSIPTGTTSSDWLTSSVSALIPSDGTANSIRVHIAYSAAQASGSILEFAQPQLEVGTLRTGFQTATGTIQGELAACQRYYYRSITGAAYAVLGTGYGGSSTVAYTGTILPVQMRVKPTSVDFSGLATNFGGAFYAISAAALSSDSSTSNIGWVEWTAGAGMTGGNPYVLRANNNANGYVGFSAEL